MFEMGGNLMKGVVVMIPSGIGRVLNAAKRSVDVMVGDPSSQVHRIV
jgi:hypothetical protein